MFLSKMSESDVPNVISDDLIRECIQASWVELLFGFLSIRITWAAYS